MKHLPKHLRPRWRYIAVGLESWAGHDLDRKTFQKELWVATQTLLGDAGSAEVDLSVLTFRFVAGDGHAVVRTRRSQVGRARAALTCIHEVDGVPLGVQVRGVSGTVRACEENYIRAPPETPEERAVAFADADRRAACRGERYDVHVGDGFAGATKLDIQD